jgi:hypothetical protein
MPSERHDLNCGADIVRQAMTATLLGWASGRFPALVHGQELRFESGSGADVHSH